MPAEQASSHDGRFIRARLNRNVAFRRKGYSRRARKKPALEEEAGRAFLLTQLPSRWEERGQRHFFQIQCMVAMCQVDATCSRGPAIIAGRKRVHNPDEIMAEIVAKWLAEHLKRKRV